MRGRLLLLLFPLLTACAGPDRLAATHSPHRFDATPVARHRLGKSHPEETPAAEASFYAVQEINRLWPRVTVWRNGRCGERHQQETTQYLHRGRLALFDRRGRRLTRFRFTDLAEIGFGHLAYTGRESDEDSFAAYVATTHGGLGQPWVLDTGQHPRYFGLLDRRGRPRTKALYLKLQAVGPNAIWAVRADSCLPYQAPPTVWPITYQLTYGLLDSLGRVVLPFEPGPLSLADAAGLLRRRSHAPQPKNDYQATPPTYPAGTTTRYYRLDGQPAFTGQYTAAAPFWQGQAVVEAEGRYGLIDTQGRWLIPPGPADLRTRPRSDAQGLHDLATDPLNLFDPLDAYRAQWWSSYRIYYPKSR